jgi:phage internal scaffolding protein
MSQISKDSIIVFRSGNDGRQAYYSDLSGLSCPEPTLAQQQFKDDCNLNSIMERYNRTGELTHFRDVAASYGDFTAISDLHSALNTVHAAQSTFDALPADLRARFFNDPARFVDFCSDAKNLPELASLGLLSPEASARLIESAVADASGDLAPKVPKSSKSSVKASNADSGGTSGGD